MSGSDLNRKPCFFEVCLPLELLFRELSTILIKPFASTRHYFERLVTSLHQICHFDHPHGCIRILIWQIFGSKCVQQGHIYGVKVLHVEKYAMWLSTYLCKISWQYQHTLQYPYTVSKATTVQGYSLNRSKFATNGLDIFV